jgi:hypothetical protein
MRGLAMLRSYHCALHRFTSFHIISYPLAHLVRIIRGGSTEKLYEDIAKEIAHGDRAIHVHRQTDCRIDKSASHICNQVDNERETTTNNERVAIAREDDEKKEEGAEVLVEIRGESDFHVLLLCL